MSQESNQELSKEDAELLIKSISELEREEAQQTDESRDGSEKDSDKP